MPKKYSEFPIEKLRELLLNGTLIHENMEQEDYAILIENELESPEPDNEVIKLCASALDRFNEYKELGKISINIKEFIKKANKEKTPKKHRKIKKISFIAAAVITMLFISQLVASAMGFDLFGYILNWGKEQLVVKHNFEHDFDNEDSDNEFEPVYTTYENLSDVPSDIKKLLPSIITENYKFSFASLYIEKYNKFSYTFRFIIDNDTTCSLYVSKGVEFYTEKDNEFFEEYKSNGKDFTIYKNLEYYKVIWIDDGFLYDMGVNLSIDEVKEIINNF